MDQVLVDVVLITAGVVVRQVDRWWHSDLRSGLFLSRAARSTTIQEVFVRQRSRRNNVTPAMVMIGHWIEIAGWCLLCDRPGVAGVVLATAALAVKGRHLQEVSHFGVHTALCRSRRFGDMLTEWGAQGPLGLATVTDRRESHVRQHHPNATVAGVDPNLAELAAAGLRPGCSLVRFLAVVGHPLTPVGCLRTVQTMCANLWSGPGARGRLPLVAGLLVAGYLLGGVAALVAIGLARLVLYPQLAWLSLLVEHRWLDAERRRGRPREVEAGRCVRVYQARPLLGTLARLTWLPYGDVYHFAHSVYPTVRWNYLPTVERLIGLPRFKPSHLLLSRSSVLVELYRSSRRRTVASPAAA
ncbi:MAG: fatty acid desaturase [Micromonosporaceae bacterium]